MDRTNSTARYLNMQAMPGAKPHHPMPGLLMKSFFGITPRDEISQVVGQWLLEVCRGLQNVEVRLSQT